jgi:predicted Zn-dependent protease with MMP-like domain
MANVRATGAPSVEAVMVSRRRFEQLVADALDSIPDDLAEAVENVAVLVEDWPTPEQLDGRGGTLLGLYEGVDLTQRSPLGYAGVLPDRITLFRGPLCAISHDEDDLAEHVRVTLVHELAHHFGIDDDRLDELGWA